MGTSLTALAVIASTLAMTRDTAPLPHHAAAALVGTDGHAEILVQGRERVSTIETGDLPGVRALLAGPQSFLSTGYGVEQIYTRHWLRMSRVNRGSAGFEGRSDTLYALDETGLVGHVNDDGERFVSFKPGVLELPADVHAGSSWESKGTMFGGTGIQVDSSAEYAYTARAQAAPAPFGGCLEVAGRLLVGTSSFDSRTTWCPGRGIVAETDSEGSRAAASGFPDWADPRTAVETEAPRAAFDPAAATLTTIPSATLPLTPDPVGEPSFGIHAAAVSSRSGPNVIGFTIAPKGITRTWRATPGGIAFVQATFGDVTVVGTTQRRLVAYDADGQRLWSVETPETPTRFSFVRLDGSSMVVTFTDGRVGAYDLRTGASRWEQHLDGDLQAPAVVADGRVLVTTPTGALVAFDAVSGTEQWRTQLPDACSPVAAGQGQVFASSLTQGRVYALDGATGRAQWEWIEHDDRTALIALPGQLVVVGETVTYGLDRAGTRVLWRQPVTGRSMLLGDQLLLVDDSVVVSVAFDGRQTGRWTVPARPRRPESTWIAAGPSGSALISDSWFNLYRLGHS